MKTFNKTLLMLLALSVIMVSFFSCKKTDKFSTDKVVMTYVSSPLNVPSVLEKNSGMFSKAYEKLGLQFEYSNLTSGADQTAALASGSIHILNAVGGSSVLLAAANGADISIISMYSMAPKAFCMFSRDASINSPEDLRGLTIAGPKGTNLHELLVAFLATGGMKISDVNYVSMSIPAAVAALEGGSVNVAMTGGTASYNLEKSGFHKITSGENLIAAVICTACSREFAEKNPEIIETFRQTQKEIVEYMNNNTEEALKITADALDIDLNAVKEMYPLYDFGIELTDEKLDALQETEKFLFNSGMIDNHVDVRSLVLEK
jgi:sulfonate transport system substrate-binding protein